MAAPLLRQPSGRDCGAFFMRQEAFLCAGSGGPTPRHPIAPTGPPRLAPRTPDTHTVIGRGAGLGPDPAGHRGADRWGMPAGRPWGQDPTWGWLRGPPLPWHPTAALPIGPQPGQLWPQGWQKGMPEVWHKGDVEPPRAAPCPVSTERCSSTSLWCGASRPWGSSGAVGVSPHPGPHEGSTGRPGGASPTVQPWYRILPEGGGLELI